MDTLDDAARSAVMTSAWAAHRWNVFVLAVPGLPQGSPPGRPNLAQRRARAVAAVLATQGIRTVPAPAAGQRFSRSISVTARQ
jgi:hypothetical protein